MLIYFHWEKKSISSKLSFQSYRLLLYVLYVLHVNWNQRIKICLNKILKELGWSKLANRRTNHRLVYFYKILNNLAPKYLKRLCNLTSHNTNNYLLRRNNSFLVPTIHVHRESFSKSCFPKTIQDWNNLANSIKQSQSLTIFKAKINSL